MIRKLIDKKVAKVCKSTENKRKWGAQKQVVWTCRERERDHEEIVKKGVGVVPEQDLLGGSRKT